jgi:hypothetical protein
MGDLIDEIEKIEPNFLGRHMGNALLSYITNDRKRGIYCVEYRNKKEAIKNFQHVYLYFMDEDEIRKLSAKVDIRCDGERCDLNRCYDAYRPEFQVILLIIINGEKFLQIVDYTPEDLGKFERHLDCMEKVSSCIDKEE